MLKGGETLQINCLNPISKVADWIVLQHTIKETDNMNDAEGVLVYSASMHEMDLPENLLAVARAGARCIKHSSG